MLEKAKEILERIREIKGLSNLIVPSTDPKYKTIRTIYFKCLGIPYLFVFLLGVFQANGFNDIITFLFLGCATFSVSGFYIAKKLIDNLPPSELYSFFNQRNDEIKKYQFLDNNIYEISTLKGLYTVIMENSEVLSCIDKTNNFDILSTRNKKRKNSLM